MVEHYDSLLDCIIGDFREEFNIVPKMDLIYTESFTERNLKTDPIVIPTNGYDAVRIELVVESENKSPITITIN